MRLSTRDLSLSEAELNIGIIMDALGLEHHDEMKNFAHHDLVNLLDANDKKMNEGERLQKQLYRRFLISARLRHFGKQGEFLVVCCTSHERNY